MSDKPQNVTGYADELATLIVPALLYIATKLGDLMDEILLIGGLAPTFLVDQESLPDGADAHAGTLDLDLGLQVSLLDSGRYQDVSERLRQAGFEMDTNEAGNPTRQRWRMDTPGPITVDFLIPPSRDGDKGGRLRNIEPDFAAIIAPGLRCAFRDRREVVLDGMTIMGEKAKRTIWVCDIGAFLVLKALAFRSRGENKDAYDLFYVLRNAGDGPSTAALHLTALLDDEEAQNAVTILREDFVDPDGVGPRRVAEFLFGRPDDNLQADVAGFVGELLSRLD